MSHRKSVIDLPAQDQRRERPFLRSLEDGARAGALRRSEGRMKQALFEVRAARQRKRIDVKAPLTQGLQQIARGHRRVHSPDRLLSLQDRGYGPLPSTAQDD